MGLTAPNHRLRAAFPILLRGAGGVAVAILLVASCSPSVLEFDPGAGGGTGGDKSEPVEFCGGVTCTNGQRCCYATGQCFDEADGAAACEKPDGGALMTASDECNSDLDCAAGSYCFASCVGSGQCFALDNSDCREDGHTWKTCCCDGKTRTVFDACRAHVSIAATGAGICGVLKANGRQDRIDCGIDANCPDGFQCCQVTGLCFDANKPANCAMPPRPFRFACTDDTDCETFCIDTACGGPRACWTGQRPECTSLNAPVCGCDGKTYLNDGCALHHHVAVEHDFPCK